MKKKSDYEKELEEFYDIDDNNSNDPYKDCGTDTTIRTAEDLAEMMGNEYQHVINHFNKNKDS
jgi:hypothetical protein